MSHRPHPMDPLLEDFTPLAERFGRSTADSDGDHAEAHRTALAFSKFAAIKWARMVTKHSVALTLKAAGALIVSAAALLALYAMTGRVGLPVVIAGIVAAVSSGVLLWHWLGRWAIARTEAGRRIMGFTKLEPRVLAAYTARRAELGLPGCDCTARPPGGDLGRRRA